MSKLQQGISYPYIPLKKAIQIQHFVENFENHTQPKYHLHLQLAIRGQFLIEQRQETTGNDCSAQDHMTGSQ